MTSLLRSSTATAPRRITRIAAVLMAAYRILFLKWPRYSFDDLATIQDSLDGPAFSRAARRMRCHPDGARMMDEKPELTLHTVDWHALSMLPVDTLGYNFWHHFYVNGLLKEVKLSEPVVRWDPDTEYAKHRYRATHDARHVLTGLGVEGYEEVLLQAFQFAQLPQKLSALIVVFGGLKHAILDGKWRALLSGIPRAWRSGRQARFLSNLPLEELWAVPLEEVRRQWGVRPVGSLYPVRERHPDAPGGLSRAYEMSA